jgi:hypothetical protein
MVPDIPPGVHWLAITLPSWHPLYQVNKPSLQQGLQFTSDAIG